MPRGDGAGPGGMGPMTGRAAGYCAGYPVPGHANPIAGRGFGFWGRGRGGGRGYRHWFRTTGLPRWAQAGYGFPASGGPVAPYAPAMRYAAVADREPEIEGLRRRAELFEGALADIRKRMEQLESERKE